MKVALLCAIVFGAISVAASSSQNLADEHFVQNSSGQRAKTSANKHGSAKKSNTARHQHGHNGHEHEKISEHLIKRAEGQLLEIGDNLAGVLKDVKGKGDTIINHYGQSPAAAGHMPGGAPHPYYPPPPAYGHDAATAASLEKISKKLDKLKDGHKINSQQIELMQELQAKQMAGAEGATAAAAKPKRGMSKSTLALLGIGGIGLGYGATKLFDTKPSDSTTGYSQQDMAALQGAGAAAPGTAPVDGAPGGQGGDPGYDGPYPIPGSSLVYIVDRQNYVHVLDPAQKYAEVPPPRGWQPPGSAPAGGAGGAGSAGPGASSAVSAPAIGAGAGGAGSVAGAGQAAGASTAQAGDGGASSAGQGVSAQRTQDGNTASQSAPSDSGAAAGQSTGGNKPVWDPEVGMYYIVGPQSVRYYVDDKTGYLINSETMDVSDPKTGKIIYSGKDIDNASAGGTAGGARGGGATGAGGAGGAGGADGAGGSGGSGGSGDAGQGQAPAGNDLSSTGAGNGSGAGRMQKRSLRHRKLDTRSYATVATQATNPALRAQAQLAMLRESGGSAAAAASGGGWVKPAAKIGLGVGALLALVVGLGEYAHPKRPNTTPDNEYGLTPTNVCDIYGEPIIMDFKGRLWNKSTYTQVDRNNPPPVHQCSQQELADNGANAGTVGAASGAASGPAPVPGMQQQKRDLQTQEFPAKLIAAVKEADAHEAVTPSMENTEGKSHTLEKRQGKAAAGGIAGMASMLVPSLSAGGAMAVGAGVLITALYLHGIHEKKLKAAQDEYNSKFHSAGEAASSVGNAISTGANGQLFNPITGNLVLVDSSTNKYYDSGTGEEVNPKTGIPGGEDNDASSKQEKVQLPIDSSGNVSGDSPQVQQAMSKWNAMTPQQQQQLLAQYGDVANQILSSPDPNAALQAWSNQQAQTSALAVQQQQQQLHLAQPAAGGAGLGDASSGM